MYWAYTTDEEERFTPECKSNALRRIFEEKSVFEEGVYRAYTTDEEERFIPKIPAKTRRLR